jgi:hypothetical protein
MDRKYLITLVCLFVFFWWTKNFLMKKLPVYLYMDKMLLSVMLTYSIFTVIRTVGFFSTITLPAYNCPIYNHVTMIMTPYSCPVPAMCVIFWTRYVTSDAWFSCAGWVGSHLEHVITVVHGFPLRAGWVRRHLERVTTVVHAVPVQVE